ncbi:serine hydrolase [Streptomyces sp. CBMA152]|uniref:serine hydrolase domain-containing protein n=1 Tax=Streptomyces sp. CBMA152 TaxID=1896312 RepID=UPI001660ECAC|nr:serine hydrolase domain-containing protein [Streptomyces sp. CBMA152]MBD0740913.1 serine hydrolase [Streptomyces sp. CBMA152]
MAPVPLCVLSESAPLRIENGHDPRLFVQIGSLTKPLTGTLLVSLAAEGALALDDPLERFLPVPPGTGITLRHLAEHTSGLPRLPPGLRRFRDPYAPFDAPALDGLLRRLDSLTTARPGEREEYSNFGYAVLGSALAVAGGAPYEELLGRYVLAALGISDVTSTPPHDRRLVARGLFGRPVTPWTMTGAILPAGGLWATSHSTARLVTSLLVERRLGDPAPSWQRAGGLLWHNGATKDASVFTGALPDGRWVVVHRLSGDAETTDKIGVELLNS